MATVEGLCYALSNTVILMIETVYSMVASMAEALCYEFILPLPQTMLLYLASKVMCLLHEANKVEQIPEEKKYPNNWEHWHMDNAAAKRSRDLSS